MLGSLDVLWLTALDLLPLPGLFCCIWLFWTSATAAPSPSSLIHAARHASSGSINLGSELKHSLRLRARLQARAKVCCQCCGKSSKHLARGSSTPVCCGGFKARRSSDIRGGGRAHLTRKRSAISVECLEPHVDVGSCRTTEQQRSSWTFVVQLHVLTSP